MYHNPVMLQEVIDGLAIRPDGVYVDATFGGGGHSEQILKKLDQGRLLGFDQDEDAMQNAFDDDRFIFVNANFRFLKNFLRFYDAIPVDGILADLGVSSHQFDTAERGFSTRFDSNLDLRMDRRINKDGRKVINDYSEHDLKTIFRNYGEIGNAAQLARTIIGERKRKSINTSAELVAIAKRFTRKPMENKYLAQVFQAIRIEVNDELKVLKDFLKQCHIVLKSGGRLVVISYHSLEDRLVKNYFKSGNFAGEIQKDFYGNPQLKFKTINRKPITASEEEIKENGRARSAKLRIAEKI
ncbi:MAG: 16S rRNA (cytosine(1402)-N(4))-methyltransferase RsmH [Bacteroidales bacterium]|nr:16S rRNA (cytosine(1402)-N(4))-methyltransferase RsmH [Bacteroidales bacterium]MCF8387628.1 16S rRNA (cytosine(1402)-N(4))-methyltransferase RsmH [Bacteroidales bacterium]MCF8397936.1 16S rRNA (cytosine(1402)-N(4))-methyltransferase RsmH [Bacteroidales bacterium]